MSVELELDRAIVQAVCPGLFRHLGELSKACPDVELKDRADRLASFWAAVQPYAIAGAPRIVDMLPQVYVALDDMLDVVTPDKRTLIDIKKQLPAWCPHSMEQSPPQGKAKK